MGREEFDHWPPLMLGLRWAVVYAIDLEAFQVEHDAVLWDAILFRFG